MPRVDDNHLRNEWIVSRIISVMVNFRKIAYI